MADAPGAQRKIIGRTAQLDDTFAEISIYDFGPGISSTDLEKVLIDSSPPKRKVWGWGYP